MFVKARVRLLFSGALALGAAIAIMAFGKYICHSYVLFVIASLMLSNFVAAITEFAMLQRMKENLSEGDTVYTFGFVRAGMIGTVVNQIFLFGLFLYVLAESIKSFAELTFDAEEAQESIRNMTEHNITISEAVEVDDSTIHYPHVAKGYSILYTSVGALIVQFLIFIFYHLHGYLWHRLNLSENSVGRQAEALLADPYFNINPWTSSLASWQNLALSTDSVANLDGKTHNHTVIASGGNDSSGCKTKCARRGPIYNRAWKRTLVLDVAGTFVACLVGKLLAVILIFNPSVNSYYMEFADPVFAILLAIFVACTRGPIMKDTILILMQTLPKGIKADSMSERIVSEIDAVESVHELHIWQLTSKRLVATLHITLSRFSDYMATAAAIKRLFHSQGIHSVTLQPEFSENFVDLDTKTVEGKAVCLVDCARSSEACVAHQCCQHSAVSTNPLPVVPPTPPAEGGLQMSSRRSSHVEVCDVLRPPSGIPMIDVTAPNSPFIDPSKLSSRYNHQRTSVGPLSVGVQTARAAPAAVPKTTNV